MSLVRLRNAAGVVARVDATRAAALVAGGWVPVDGSAPRRKGRPLEITQSADPAQGQPQKAAAVNGAEDAPKPYASRGEWAQYAESVGIEAGEMTKAEIRAAVAEL